MRGVFLVAAELTAHGLIVSPTSRGAFGADLLVTDLGCNKAWSVQVKTNTTTFGFWLLNEKARLLISPSHVYVLVNLRKDKPPEYFVVPSSVVAERMVVEPAPRGTFYSLYNDEVVQQYKEKWSVFEGV
jgi:hypothetical protein